MDYPYIPTYLAAPLKVYLIQINFVYQSGKGREGQETVLETPRPLSNTNFGAPDNF